MRERIRHRKKKENIDIYALCMKKNIGTVGAAFFLAMTRGRRRLMFFASCLVCLLLFGVGG